MWKHEESAPTRKELSTKLLQRKLKTNRLAMSKAFWVTHSTTCQHSQAKLPTGNCFSFKSALHIFKGASASLTTGRCNVNSPRKHLRNLKSVMVWMFSKVENNCSVVCNVKFNKYILIFLYTNYILCSNKDGNGINF